MIVCFCFCFAVCPVVGLLSAFRKIAKHEKSGEISKEKDAKDQRTATMKNDECKLPTNQRPTLLLLVCVCVCTVCVVWEFWYSCLSRLSSLPKCRKGRKRKDKKCQSGGKEASFGIFPTLLKR